MNVENTKDEIQTLVGATILSARIVSVDEAKAEARAAGEGEDLVEFIDQEVLRLSVRFRSGLRVNDSATGEYEVWQDVEGNGSGYLAYVGSGS